MATGRLARIVESSSEFTDEEIARMTEDDAWQWVHANASTRRQNETEPCERENIR